MFDIETWNMAEILLACLVCFILGTFLFNNKTK